MACQIQHSSADCVRFLGGWEWLFCLFCAGDSTALETDAHAHMPTCVSSPDQGSGKQPGKPECARDDGVIFRSPLKRQCVTAVMPLFVFVAWRLSCKARSASLELARPYAVPDLTPKTRGYCSERGTAGGASQLEGGRVKIPSGQTRYGLKGGLLGLFFFSGFLARWEFPVSFSPPLVFEKKNHHKIPL